ncbi:MAG: RsiV family protein [Bacteroidales bacterium]|nr:RsiV family protein [Bacteroidales bacterium]
MKKTLLPVILAVAAILAVSCKHEPEEIENYSFFSVHSASEALSKEIAQKVGDTYARATDSIDINFDLQREGLSEEATALIDAEIIAVSLGEQYRNMDICDAMAAFADSSTAVYFQECNSALSVADENMLPPAYMLSQINTIEGKVFSISENVLQYVITSYFYGGGAHGYGLDTYLAFDTQSGKRLTVDDIFADKDQLKSVLAAKAKADERTYEDLEMFISDTFLMDEEGITFMYAPYDIGCYASGQIDLNISKEELKGMVRPEAEKYWE